MPLRAVFFDLDGTLLDTADDMSAALNAIMAEDGLPPLPIHETRSIVSNGSVALVKKGYQLNDDDSQIPILRQRFLDHYQKNVCQHTHAFEGIEKLIEELNARNIVWGIATNKPWAYAEPLMKNFEFASKPVCILCPDHVAKSKPDPESLILACRAANCDPSEAIYIGDHLRDILCGKNAGMPTIAAKYGFIEDTDDADAWQADHSAESASDIWPILEQYC